MALASVTITATTGPGDTVTAAVFTNVSSIVFDLAANMIRLVTNGINKEFAYDAVATVTYTISGETATITIA